MANIFKNKKNYTQDFYKFLGEHKVARGEPYSHTSLGDPKGCYIVDTKERDKFFNLYKKALGEGAELYLSEVHRSQGPILIDIDVKYPKNLQLDDRIYKKFLNAFLKEYNIIISKYLIFEEEDFLTFIFEKSKPTEKEDCFKDGIHIVYPRICATNKLQYVMRNDLVIRLNEIGLFDNLGLLNKTEDIVDKAVIETNNWMMYGSCKPGTPPYLLTQIFNYELKDQDTSKYDNEFIHEYLSIRKFGKENLTEYRDGYDEKKILGEYEKLNRKRVVVGRKTFSVVSNQEDIKTAKELTDILNPDRAKSYEGWLSVGFCLHNIDYCLIETWIEFSKLASNFKEGECEKMWDTFRNNNYSLGSLYRWAKEDNPEKFADLLMTKVNEAILESIDGSSYSIAKAFYKIYRFNYVCANIKTNLWYEYKSHRWIECEEGHTIYTKLNEDMAGEYVKLSHALFTKALIPAITAKEKEELLDKRKKVDKIFEKIRNVSLKNNIITECRTIFFDPTFASRLNENKNVIVFNNGVYDFKEHKFRDGLPEDVMSYTTNINFIKFDENNNYVKEIIKYFFEVQPELDMNKYILDLLSGCLIGNIPDEKFQIWTGTGCHAKGTQILMYDGNLRKVEDVQTGEYVMGDDSRRRLVTELFRGRAKMYRINQTDFFSSYVVNGEHILSLRIINSKIAINFKGFNVYQTEGYYYIDIKVEDYLKLPETSRKLLYGYKRKILDNHHYNNDFNFNQMNINNMNDLNNIHNKFEIQIDEQLYKNTRLLKINKRMMILDNLIENGSEINITKYNDLVVDQIVMLCHSVGYHLIIYTDIIKIFKNSIPLSKIDVVPLEEDDFYGFQLSGNHRYMLEDGTITHNSNGKSLTVDMLNAALNDYATEVQVTLLTRKRADATQANPELAKTKGKRFVTLQEPENQDTLQIGFLKSLTGGAKVSTRNLHERTFEFEPQFKLFLLCNKVPEIPSNDGGTWRRIRVTPWELKFCNNPIKPNERQMDISLKDKIKTDPWKEALLSYLIHHYETYVKGKPVPEPNKVIKYTQMYQDLADIYQNYIHDRLEITNNKKDKITYKILYEDFKDWFQLTRNTRTTIKFGEFKIELLQKLPDDVTDTMKGIKLRPADVKPKADIENFVDDNDGEEDNTKNEEEKGEASYA
jgi:P4 family phage/plasmid primase-like protien